MTGNSACAFERCPLDDALRNDALSELTLECSAEPLADGHYLLLMSASAIHAERLLIYLSMAYLLSDMIVVHEQGTLDAQPDQSKTPEIVKLLSAFWDGTGLLSAKTAHAARAAPPYLLYLVHSVDKEPSTAK